MRRILRTRKANDFCAICGICAGLTNMQSALEKLRRLRLRKVVSSTPPPTPPVPRDKTQGLGVRASFQSANDSRRTQAELSALVNEGWEPLAWANRLNQLADLCQELNPELAEQHRKRAAAII